MLPEVLKYLVEHIKKIIRAHLTALFLKAAQSNNAFYVKLLLILGADINAKDIYGNTALHIACRNKMKQLFEVLINNAGLDISINDADGQLAIYVADANNYPEATNRLLIMDIGQMVNIPITHDETAIYCPPTAAELTTVSDNSSDSEVEVELEPEYEYINTPPQEAPKSALILNSHDRLKREKRVKTNKDNLTITINETAEVHVFKTRKRKSAH